MSKNKTIEGNKIYHPHQFTFKGKTYECIGEDRDWQIIQFRFAIKDKQWITVSNRIINQLKWGPNIREVN